MNRAIRIPVRTQAQAAQAPPEPAPAQLSVKHLEPAPAPLPKPSARHFADTREASYAPLEALETSSHPDAPDASAAFEEPAIAPASIASKPAVKPTPKSASMPLAKSTMKPAGSLFLQVIRLLQWTYCIVGAVLLLRIAIGLGRTYLLWRASRPIAQLSDSGRDIRVSQSLATPVTIGSTILLPANYREWDADKLRIVLAHEQSHVSHGDFYLQLIAAVHAAIFWFSPLGWWLQRKLTELGEALGDRAGLEQASSPSSYARILLEFAATPRPTATLGVAMARNTNVSSRIERILNATRFHLAFHGSRKSALLTAVLVPVALLAVLTGVRMVPAVEAAHGQSATAISGKVAGKIDAKPLAQQGQQVAGDISGQIGDVSTDSATGLATDTVGDFASDAETGQLKVLSQIDSKNPISGQITGQVSGQVAGQVTTIAPPEPPEPEVKVQEPPTPPEAPEEPRHMSFHFDWNGGNFAIIHQSPDGSVRWKGEYDDSIARAREKLNLKGDYILVERDSKMYAITDPKLLAEAQAAFKEDPRLEARQQALKMKMAELNRQMASLAPEMAKASLPGPEFDKQMKDLQKELAELQSDKYKKMIEDMTRDLQKDNKLDTEAIQQITQERLGALQEKIGDIQGKIGDIQGKIGERQGLIGEKQGELGERMGQIGEEQGRRAEEAMRRVQSALEQAIRDGKAKPVE
jgi:beta-lactamase regulating signal transducer with metallopeptidase domain